VKSVGLSQEKRGIAPSFLAGGAKAGGSGKILKKFRKILAKPGVVWYYNQA
jgi:hypothetical protein